MKSIGILLAGGASRRFGSPKAFAKLDGRMFYEYSYDALQTVCDDVVIVTREELVNGFPNDLNVITDVPKYKGMGPLAGIYTVQAKFKADQYVVLPCDMPYMTGEILKSFISKLNEANVFAIKCGERKHPLVSIWTHNLKEPLKIALEQKRLSVMEFLSTTNTKWIEAEQLTEDPAKYFQNINEPKRM